MHQPARGRLRPPVPPLRPALDALQRWVALRREVRWTLLLLLGPPLLLLLWLRFGEFHT